MRTLHKIIYIALFLLKLGATYDLPEFIKPCAINSNLSNCSHHVLESLRPHLVKGISELNIPPIDPLHVSGRKVFRTNSHLLYFNGIFGNMIWTGCKDFHISDIFINPDEFIFRLKLGFPYLFVIGDGFIEGKVLTFDMNNSGVFHVNYTNVVLDVVLNGEPYYSKGHEFIKWKKEDIAISFDDSYFTHLTGFLGDAAYAELFMLSLNNAGRILTAGFRAVVDVGIGDFIVQIINRAHERFPKDVLYRTANADF